MPLRADAAVAAPQQREFKMHAKLLDDIMTRQAGTLAKAIMEAAMNAIDARASRFDILLSPVSVDLVDDGRGIKTEKELDHVFDTFGQPHTEEEAKIYGTFRMGRGQMFAFGRNVWETNSFIMDVDIKKNPRGYKLTKTRTPRKGCKITIDLFRQLDQSEYFETINTLKKCLKYSQIPVTLNREVISVDPKTLEWDFITDDAYVRLNAKTQLDIYNLGVFVFDLSSWNYGSGGTVVTKKRVQVNFARNDIQSDCVVWQAIKKEIKDRTIKEQAEKIALNPEERVSLFRRIISQQEPNISKYRKSGVPLFPLYTGELISADQLYARFRKAGHRYTVMTEAVDVNDLRMADRIDQERRAVVLSHKIWAMLSDDDLKDPVEELELVVEALISSYRNAYVPYATLTASAKAPTYKTIPAEEWTAHDKLWVNMLARTPSPDAVLHQLSFAESNRIRHESAQAGDRAYLPRDDFNEYGGTAPRKIMVGDSEGTAHAWTDGATTIWFDQRYLSRMTFSMADILTVLGCFAHEYSHTPHDADAIDHSGEFYARFHRVVRDVMPEWWRTMWSKLPNVVKVASKLGARQRAVSNMERTCRILVKAAEALNADLTNPEVPATQAPVRRARSRRSQSALVS